MSSFNKTILQGFLGKDPEIKTMQSGKSMAMFSIATTEYWKDASGTKQTKTDWHNCVAFGGVVSVIEKYLSKGSNVLVEGKLSNSDYTDDNGVKKRSVQVLVQNIVLQGKSTGSNQQQEEEQPQQEEKTPPASTGKKRGRPSTKESDDDGDMPF